MNFTKRAGNDGTSRPDDGIRRLGGRADGGRDGGRNGGTPDQPRDEFVEAFRRQLAARFSTTPPAAALFVTPATPAVKDDPASAEVDTPRPAPDFRMPDLRAPEVEAPEFEDPPPKPEVERKTAPAARLPRPAPLVHSFFLGAALATAFCLYFFSRTDPPPPAPTAAAVATVPSPPPPEAPIDRPVVAASPPAEAPPISREQSAPAATVHDDAPSTIDRETTDGDRALTPGDIREIQTRLLSLGLRPGPVDGVAGRQTTAAIQGYLRSRGQAMPTRLDRALLERLRQETRGR